MSNPKSGDYVSTETRGWLRVDSAYDLTPEQTARINTIIAEHQDPA